MNSLSFSPPSKSLLKRTWLAHFQREQPLSPALLFSTHTYSQPPTPHVVLPLLPCTSHSRRIAHGSIPSAATTPPISPSLHTGQQNCPSLFPCTQATPPTSSQPPTPNNNRTPHYILFVCLHRPQRAHRAWEHPLCSNKTAQLLFIYLFLTLFAHRPQWAHRAWEHPLCSSSGIIISWWGRWRRGIVTHRPHACHERRWRQQCGQHVPARISCLWRRGFGHCNG